ncbi:MAG: J domain-containing protein [Bacteroidota bacterium]
MQYKDYYRVLGVARSASEEEIRKAYKKLAMRWHPDQNPDNPQAEEKFKEINEAKEVLLNADYRRRYDQMGANWQHARAGAGANARPGTPPQEAEINNIFSIFFNEIFGNRSAPRAGKNRQGNLKITLDEAYSGIQETLQFEGKRFKVKIPPGVSHGQILKLKGKGKDGKNGGMSGDLMIKIQVIPHARYTRKGDDLYLEKTVSLYDAVLGRKVPIQTLKGKMGVAIPPGTQYGDKLKLKGLGMPIYDNPRFFGSLYLTVKIKIPKRLTAKQKELFEQLEALTS